MDKGFAYESDGDVYYRTRKFDGYGKLSHQSIDELTMLVLELKLVRKKKILLILLFGKRQKKAKFLGIVHGGKDDQVGILNALLWLVNILAIQLISMRVVKI